MKNYLQELRWEKNWSQAQLSRFSNVPRSVISKIENLETKNPSVLTAIKLSSTLGVDVIDIFKFEQLTLQ